MDYFTLLLSITLCLIYHDVRAAAFVVDFDLHPPPELPVNISTTSESKAACPCSDPTLCDTIQGTREEEIYVFSVSNKYWKQYDWKHITTVVMVNYYDPELMCYAHSKGVRVVAMGEFSVEILTNVTARVEWISNQVIYAVDHHLDGINLDIEFPLDAKDAHLLTDMVQMTAKAFKDSIPGSQVSFDIAWSPDCIDNRCYDAKAIANAVDFLFVMSYDEQSQIYGDCIAKANAEYDKTVQGIEAFLKLGIPTSKLVMGMPWYGFNYPCLHLSENYFHYAKKMGLFGVGPWNGDLLNYNDDPIAKKQTKVMRDTMATLLDKYVMSDKSYVGYHGNFPG